MNDKISVIIPIYNVEKYLCKCIDSVLAQTYTNLEIILVDDGSPDGCGVICDEYAKRDKRIKVIHKENGGLSDARNAGIEAATGAYIGFVDSDDYIREDMYELMYNSIETNDTDIAVIGVQRVDENGKCIYFLKEQGVYNGIDILNNCLMSMWEVTVIACNKLFKRELFDGVRYPKGKLHEDSFVIHELLHRAHRVEYIDELCYFYLCNPCSIQGASYSVKRLDDAEAFITRIKFYLEKNLSLKETHKNINFLINLFYKSYIFGSIIDKQYVSRRTELRRQLKRIIKEYRKRLFGNRINKTEIKLLMFLYMPYMLYLEIYIKQKIKRIQASK